MFVAEGSDIGVNDRPRRVLTAIAFGAVVVLIVVYLLAVRTRWGQRLDATALRGQRGLDEDSVDAAAAVMTVVSVASLVFLGGAIVIVALLRSRPRLAFAVATMIVGSLLTTEVLKRAILERPRLGINDPLQNLQSFPSGHTTVAMALGVGAMLVTPSRHRVLVAALGASFASAMGAAVVATGNHRPSDPIGAALVVTAWAAGLCALLLRSSRTERRETPGPHLGPWFGAGGLILLVVGFIGLATTVTAIRGNELDTVELGNAFIAATSAIVGTIFVCTGALLAAIRGVDLDPRSQRNAFSAG